MLNAFQPPPLSKDTFYFVIKASVIASIGGLLFGYDVGVIAAAIDQLQSAVSFFYISFFCETIVAIGIVYAYIHMYIDVYNLCGTFIWNGGSLYIV